MNLLQRENVQILEQAIDWRDAIRKAVIPLEAGGYVETCYKEEIIKNVESMGPYIVIAEHIALPHARPEQGVNKTQMSITLYRNEVLFDGKDMPASLFITLAAADNNSHLDALMTVSELLADEEKVRQILEVPDVDGLYNYFANL